MTTFTQKYIGEPSQLFTAKTAPIWIVLLASLTLGAVGSFAFTELGQIVDMPRAWVFNLFEVRTSVNIALVASLALVVVVNQRINSPFKNGFMIFYGLVIFACLFFINLFASEVWLRAQHHTAEFMSVADADKRLQDDDDVFVLVINGDARAYPRDWMQVPHIAGDEIGGEEAVMTYCALSNLPLAFDSDFNGEDANYRVIAQVNNNLIFSDRNSGELIQQITGTAEYSDTRLGQHPVQRMPWKSFKALYPEGQVFNYTPNLLDRITMALFDKSLVNHYQGDPMFPTLDLEDDRLPTGEVVWGLNINDEQLAITRAAMSQNAVRTVKVGGEDIVVAWFDDYQLMGAWYLPEGVVVNNIEEIDPYGRVGETSLQAANLYSGLFWMIWSHWFPGTEVLY